MDSPASSLGGQSRLPRGWGGQWDHLRFFFFCSCRHLAETHQGLSRHAAVRLPWGLPHGSTASLLGKGLGMAGDEGGLSPASFVSCSSARQPADCRHAPHWRTCWASAAPLGKDLSLLFASTRLLLGTLPFSLPTCLATASTGVRSFASRPSTPPSQYRR